MWSFFQRLSLWPWESGLRPGDKGQRVLRVQVTQDEAVGWRCFLNIWQAWEWNEYRDRNMKDPSRPRRQFVTRGQRAFTAHSQGKMMVSVGCVHLEETEVFQWSHLLGWPCTDTDRHHDRHVLPCPWPWTAPSTLASWQWPCSWLVTPWPFPPKSTTPCLLLRLLSD